MKIKALDRPKLELNAVYKDGWETILQIVEIMPSTFRYKVLKLGEDHIANLKLGETRNSNIGSPRHGTLVKLGNNLEMIKILYVGK